MSTANPVGSPNEAVTPEKSAPKKKESPADQKAGKAYESVSRDEVRVSGEKLTTEVHKTQGGSGSRIGGILRRVFHTGPGSSSPRSPTPSEKDPSEAENVPRLGRQGPEVPSREGRPTLPQRRPLPTPPQREQPSMAPQRPLPTPPQREQPSMAPQKPLPTPPQREQPSMAPQKPLPTPPRKEQPSMPSQKPLPIPPPPKRPLPSIPNEE